VARRRWTLEAARTILPDVRAHTEEAVGKVDALVERRDAEVPCSVARVELDQQISRIVSRWVRAMEALGVEAKGAWWVDFDCGSGCYCWRWPETELAWFRAYDEGVDQRARIH
jgi:hypothetical protein